MNTEAELQNTMQSFEDFSLRWSSFATKGSKHKEFFLQLKILN